MATPPIPVKTSQGQAELSTRQRRLSQRHRTVLLLVDGRRSADQVQHLAQQAGAGASCFGELLDLGMISMPEPPPVATVPIAPPPGAEPLPLDVDIPLDDVDPSVPPPPAALAASEGELESLLPAARSLHPESMGDVSESILQDFEALEAARTGDASLEEARGILLRAVRKEAPLSGSLTMLRLRRARTREEVADLINEVEARIIKPHRSIAAQQILHRARLLLDTEDVQPLR